MGYLGNTPTTQSFTAGTDYFNGTGSQTAFTLTRSVNSVNDIQVTVNNVVQQPNDAYTVSGTTLTMTSAPSSGTNNVYVRYLSTTTQTIAPSSGVALSAAIGTASSPSYSFAGDSNTGMFSPAADTIAFSEGGVENMRIDSSGNVGIGTTSPQSKLETTVSNGTHRIGINGSDTNYNVRANSGSNCSITWTENGQADRWTVGCVTGQNYLAFRSNSSNMGNGTERMRLITDQGLCVGITGNYANGTITGFNIVGSGGYTFRSDSSLAAGTGWGHFYGTSGSNTVANINIYGNGTIQNSTGSYGAYSDIKLKENIVDATPKLENLLKVRVVNYNLKSDESKQKQLGVIAQELETVFPSLIDNIVDRDSEGKELDTVTKGVKYSVFIPMLIKAVQELKAELDEAKAEIAALKEAK